MLIFQKLLTKKLFCDSTIYKKIILEKKKKKKIHENVLNLSPVLGYIFLYYFKH